MKSEIKEEFCRIMYSTDKTWYSFTFIDLGEEKEVAFNVIQKIDGTFLEIRNVFPTEDMKDETVYIPFHRIRKIKYMGNIIFEYIKNKGITRTCGSGQTSSAKDGVPSAFPGSNPGVCIRGCVPSPVEGASLKKL
jgi:hypothetical protein